MQPLVNKKVYDWNTHSRVVKPVEWVWSYSKIEQFLGCPYKMYREHVLLDVVEAKSNPFAIGSGIHDALEMIVLDNAQTKLNSPDYYVQVYQESARKSKDLADASEIDNYNFMIPNFLEKFEGKIPVPLKRDMPAKDRSKPGGYNHYWTEFFGDLYWDDVHFGGKIQCKIKGDVLTEKYTNLDWKTGSAKYKVEDLNNPFKPKALQLTLYSAWTYQALEVLGKAGWLLLLKKSKGIHPYSFQPELAHFDKLAEVINYINYQFVTMLRNTEATGKPAFYKTGHSRFDSQCRFCNYQKFCY